MGIGATVTDFDITININSVDVTSYVPYDTIRLEDFASEPSNLNFTVQNPTGVTPTFGQPVTVYWNSAPTSSQSLIFDGYIITIKNQKYDNGIVIQYDVECQDKKILLEKSIVESTDCNGSEADIITCLLNSAYPDLSSLFDFSSGINSIGNNFNLLANDESMLDKLKQLAYLSGQELLVETGSVSNIITFDTSGLGSPAGVITIATINSKGDLLLNQGISSFYTIEIAGTGNPGNCYHFSGTRNTGNPSFDMRTYAYFGIILGADIHITDITFDLRATTTSGNASVARVFFYDSLNNLLFSDLISPLTFDDTWHSYSFAALGSSWPYAGAVNYCYLAIQPSSTPVPVTVDMRLDNIEFTSPDANWGSVPKIKIGDPPNANFDIDIDLSDEFLSDLDLDIGDFGANSITVTGGIEQVAIDWIYESDGSQEHFDLETPVDNIAVYKNTGTDVSPVWTLQTSGIWGENELTGAGGTKDVLYDPDNHWLLFNTNPSNLTKSFRITGNIQKPIRVRMEDVASGDPTLAETVYDDSITTEEAAAAKASALLAQRSGVTRMAFKTYNPGLRPGTKITITDTNRGVNESLVIRQINVRWIGPNKAQFDVECGPVKYASLDTMFADTEKRLKPKPPDAALTTVIYGLLLDANNNFVIDANDKGILVRND